MSNSNANTPQVDVAKRWLEAYFGLDIENVKPLLAKNYQFQSFPESANLSEETKEQHIERWREAFGVLTKFEPIYREVIEAPGKVIIHGTGVVNTTLGDTFNYDTVLIITLIEEDGELKVVHCKDFSDPQKREAYLAGVTKAVVAQQSPAS